MTFIQSIYKYIITEDVTNIKTILGQGLPQVILNQLLSYAIKQNKLESIKVLISYCADPYYWLQLNNFYVKYYGNYATREYFKCLSQRNDKPIS